MVMRSLSEYERLSAVANDAELAMLEELAERAGLIEIAEDGWVTYPVKEQKQATWKDNRIVHEPRCTCNDCLVGVTRPAEDWTEYEGYKRL